MEKLTRTRFPICALVCLFWVCLATVAPAHARTLQYPVSDIAVLDLRVHHDQPTLVRFHDPIQATDEPRPWKVTVDQRFGADALVLRAAPNATPEQLKGTLLVGTRRYHLIINVEAAKTVDDAYETVEIIYRDELTLFQLAVYATAQLIAAKEYAEKLTEKDQELAAARQEIAQAEQRADYAQDELLGQIAANGIEELPVVIRPLAPGPLVAEPVKLLRHATSAVLIIDITNPTIRPYRWKDVRIIDERHSVNHTRRVKSNRPLENAAGTLLPALDTVSLTITFDTPPSPGASFLLQATSSDVPPEGGGISSWEIKVLNKPHENEGRRTIYAKGLAGGLWLGDGTADSELKTTSLTGFGARLTYGFTKHLDFETELVYASSGAAEFSIGDRSASLIRVQGGGLLRFGDTYMPIFRAGLGVQGTRYRTRAPNMSDVTNTELEMFSFLGAGVDVKLGEHFVAGVGATFANGLRSNTSSLEAGIHLGYGWSP